APPRGKGGPGGTPSADMRPAFRRGSGPAARLRYLGVRVERTKVPPARRRPDARRARYSPPRCHGGSEPATYTWSRDSRSPPERDARFDLLPEPIQRLIVEEARL